MFYNMKKFLKIIFISIFYIIKKKIMLTIGYIDFFFNNQYKRIRNTFIYFEKIKYMFCKIYSHMAV